MAADLEVIPKSDPRHPLAQKIIDLMYEYFELNPFNGAVQWIEDARGHVVIFTRGEYRHVLMNNIDDVGVPIRQFERLEGDEDEHEGEEERLQP